MLSLPIVDDGFINVILSKPSSGRMANTFICSSDNNGNSDIYYMKMYDSDKAIVNEMMGYILATEVGMDVPDRAFILKIGDITKALLANQCISNESINKINNGDVKYCFVVSEAPGINISSYSGDDTRKTDFFKSKISNWSKNNKLIAFDEWVANSDRNAGNMIFSNGNIYVIDHGGMPVCQCWKSSLLISDWCYPNIHLKNTKAVNVNVVESELYMESITHKKVFNKSLDYMKRIISALSLADSDYDCMIGFFEERANNPRVTSFFKEGIQRC